METEKQVTKTGGFLHLLDWHSKSRKKLFSNKDKSKRKGSDGNSSVTSLHTIDDDVSFAGSSIRESCGYGCASSVTEEDFTGTKAPNVVARLMGLDSMPRSNSIEISATPFSEKSCSNKNRDLNRDQGQYSYYNSHYFNNGAEPKFTKVIEKFKTETLPRKSAKTIPITQHKLLSPIKKKNFVPTRDADQITEAAASMIKQMHLASSGPYAGASSAPLKVKGLNQKAQTAQKTEISSQRIDDSTKAAKHVKVSSASLDYGPFCQGKSVSLALQAKSNVLKKERQNVSNGSFLISQSVGKKCGVKKPLSQKGSSALQPNNQKQNGVVHRQNMSLNCSLQRVEKENTGRKDSNGRGGSLKANSSKRKPELKEEKNQELSSSTLKMARRKQIVDPNRSSEGNQSAQRKRTYNGVKENVQFSCLEDLQATCDKGSGMMGVDVVSFTFSTPMARSEPGSWKETCSIIPANAKNRKALPDSYDSGARKFMEHNDLGTLRSRSGQMLKDLNLNSDLPQRNRGEAAELLERSAVLEDKRTEVNILDHSQGQPGTSYGRESHQRFSSHSLKEVSTFKTIPNSQDETPSVHEQDRKASDNLFPTPVSVLEFSSDTETPDLTYTINNNSTIDSASSTCPGTIVSRQGTTTTSWELEYVKEILCNIEPMLKDYSMGRTCEVLSPHLFYQIECQRLCSNARGLISRITRRLWFDCVNECTGLMFRQQRWHLWDRGLQTKMLHRNNEPADDIYDEISGWDATGEILVDELIDRDMSSKHGNWLKHDLDKYELGMQIGSSILESLIAEEIADILVL